MSQKEKAVVENSDDSSKHLKEILISIRRDYLYSQDYDTTTEIDQLIMKLLSVHGELTRSEMVKLTGIPRSTLYDNLVKLIEKGSIVKESIPRSSRGRPKVVFKLL